MTLLTLWGCTTDSIQSDKAEFTPAQFEQLPGWPSDNLQTALTAFSQICSRFSNVKSDLYVGDPALGKAADWNRLCNQLQQALPRNNAEAQIFIETNFEPELISDRKMGAEGLFTGYYEPELNGSLTPHDQFQTPLYGRPTDLITVDLSLFGDQWKGDHIAGQIEGTKFLPYDDRAAVDGGTLQGRATPLVWADDPIAAFFLEIQGSGQIRLEDGKIINLGYAAANGRPYTAIGKTLLAKGDLDRDSLTVPAIKNWLHQHPAEAQAVMETNQNVVFFKINSGAGPIGASGQVLVPATSLAVDTKTVPLGSLLWLDAAPPGENGNRWQRLLVAEDTGTAIKGVVRGDIFFGSGTEAETLAGVTKSSGFYWVLVPKPQ